MDTKNRYGSIDGLRTIASIGIVMMHVAANTNYEITGYLYQKIIPSFTSFVFLFMIISSFGTCCGYYQKVNNNQISFEEFYSKRYKKILPFFLILIVLEFIASPSLSYLYEAFADVTLLFGFLPNAGNISVIGVGWYIGLVFVFYLCFPFFCCVIRNKKRAWIAFAVSILLNYICIDYFEVGRTNILYSSCYFVAGGLIFLYIDNIEKVSKLIVVQSIVPIITMLSIIAYYVIGGNTITILFATSSLLIYAIICQPKILQNKITHFISGISMEIYLSHMAFFRVVEKLGFHKLIGDGWLQYFMTLVVVLCGAMLFSTIMQIIICEITKKLYRH